MKLKNLEETLKTQVSLVEKEEAAQKNFNKKEKESAKKFAQIEKESEKVKKYIPRVEKLEKDLELSEENKDEELAQIVPHIKSLV